MSAGEQGRYTVSPRGHPGPRDLCWRLCAVQPAEPNVAALSGVSHFINKYPKRTGLMNHHQVRASQDIWVYINPRLLILIHSLPLYQDGIAARKTSPRAHGAGR